MFNCEDEVVISGVGGWFPGCSKSLPELSRHLLDNKYLVQQQQDRWKKSSDLGEEPVFGSIGGYGDFDHAFFGMHQKLAYWTDPAARLCIERSFEAIIDAGLSPRELRGSKTNVYASSTFSDFEALMLDHFEAPSGYAIAGMSRTMIPNRISYFYDLKGQSCGFDGNWPWGELGLQMAMDAIRAGYCDAALVLASSVVHRPERTTACRPLGLISQDGLCRSFDEEASGGQRSDAVVCFVVQRADQAKRCYARVIASRCSVAGPLAAAGDPLSHHPRGIERLLRDFYEDCGEDPNKVAYLEADGSGCKLWEEAELQASGQVLARGRRSQPLLVGSVKSNVGHTDGCAGMLAMAKLIVAMETGVIPATINHAKANHNIAALRDGKLKVVTSNTALALDEDTLLAATTLGLGGTVGHVLVRPNLKAKQAACFGPGEVPRVVTVSGRSEDGVLAALEQVQFQPFDPEYLRLVQDAFTDIKGHTVRGFTIVPPLQREAPVYKVNTSERRPLVLVYSGMGSQWPGMGRDLMGLPAFGETIDRLHDVLCQRGTGLDLKHIVTNEDPHAFDDIMNSFVGITAFQIALTNVLKVMRLSPDLMIGHSLGELACGYADGCLTEEQTILASYVRGRAATEAKLVKGMMAAIGLGHREMASRGLPPSLDVACHNSSSSCTLAGPAEDVQTFVETLQAEGVFARAVNASDIAFHSRYVRPAAPLVLEGLRDIIPHPQPRSPRWLSTSVPEDRWSEPAVRFCSPDYQTNNLLSAVLFEEVLVHIPEDAVLLEIAPHGLLQAILKRALPQNQNLSLTQRGAPNGVHYALDAIGGLYSLGLNPLVSALYPAVTFPVSRGTPSLATLVSWDHTERNTFLDRPLQDCKATSTVTISADSPYMDLNGRSFRPVSEMILDVLHGFSRVMGEKNNGAAVTMRDVHVFKLVENPSSGEQQLTTSFLSSSGRFEVTDKSGDLVMCGLIKPQDDDCLVTPRPPEPPGNERRTLVGDAVYRQLRTNGSSYSQRLQTLNRVSIGEREWEAETSALLQAQLVSSLQLMQLASLMDSQSVTVPAVIRRIDFLQGNGDGILRYVRATGYIESACIRMEGVTMRLLSDATITTNAVTTNAVTTKCSPAREAGGHWQRTGTLHLEITSTKSEEFGDELQLCGVVGKRRGGSGGDRVMGVGLTGSGNDQPREPRVHDSFLWSVPATWTDQQAASVPLVYSMAYYALRVVARACSGESVLVHEGLSALGQAAIRVALGLGCTPVFVTVRDAEERDHLHSMFPQLPKEDVFTVSNFEWRLRLRRSGKGVDVGVGAVAGEPMRSSMRCMAFWGRYIHCAPHHDARTATIGTSKFLESLALFGMNADSLVSATPHKQHAVWEAMRAGIEDGTVQPIALMRVQDHCDGEEAVTVQTEAPSADATMGAGAEARQDENQNVVVDAMNEKQWNEQEDVLTGMGGVGNRLTSCLPTTHRPRRSASVCSRVGSDGVRMRRVPSRCARRSSSVNPAQSRSPTRSPSQERRPGAPPKECREVFPLVALPPLGLPMDHQTAASLNELASRLMMPVVAVEIPWPSGSSSSFAEGGLSGQARAVVDALRAQGPRGVLGLGPYNLLGWGPGTPLALEVARQLGSCDTPTCTFLLDGDLRAVQIWATQLASTKSGELGIHEPLRPILSDLGTHACDGLTGSETLQLPKGGLQIVVLRGSSKEKTSLEGLANVEVRTVRPARLDSPEVADAINGAAAWSRMAREETLRTIRDYAF